MNRFEQLIEYVINDEEQKARELFHDIVVEKSREIYENIMAEEAQEDEELDEAKHEEEEELDEAMGGDAADDLIDDVEMDEESDMHMEAEDEDEMSADMDQDDEDDKEDHHADVGGDEELEDRVMDLEDKLDELMAEFEELMGDDQDGDGDMMGPDEGGDAIEMDDTEEMDVDMDMDMEPRPAMEAVSLKAAPKPVTAEEGSVNKKSVNANNTGARGSMADPVRMTGDTAQGRPAPTAKDMIGRVGNTPAQGTQKPAAATKPHLAQATGVNVKSPLPSGRKG